jgi:hypothetical protein
MEVMVKRLPGRVYVATVHRGQETYRMETVAWVSAGPDDYDFRRLFASVFVELLTKWGVLDEGEVTAWRTRSSWAGRG